MLLNWYGLICSFRGTREAFPYSTMPKYTKGEHVQLYEYKPDVQLEWTTMECLSLNQTKYWVFPNICDQFVRKTSVMSVLRTWLTMHFFCWASDGGHVLDQIFNRLSRAAFILKNKQYFLCLGKTQKCTTLSNQIKNQWFKIQAITKQSISTCCSLTFKSDCITIFFVL